MKKRIFAVLLALVMALALLPATAFAAAGDEFTVDCAEGVAVNYKVLTEDNTTHTGTVWVGDGNNRSITDRDYDGNVTIPGTVTRDVGGITYTYTVTAVNSYAFSLMYNLRDVRLPDSITSIGNNAFWTCTRLEMTELPDGITSIGDNAFSATTIALTKLPDSLTTIGSGAFAASNGLALTDLPEGLTSIGENAFDSCEDITQLSLPAGLTTIGSNAFKDCTGLTALICAATDAPHIPRSAFSGCPINTLKVPIGATDYVPEYGWPVPITRTELATVYGAVKTGSGTGIVGATVTLGSYNTVTTTGGVFSFLPGEVAASTYTASAAKSGYFNTTPPAAASVTVGTDANASLSLTMEAMEYGISLSQTGTHTFTAKQAGYSDSDITPLSVTVTNTGNQPTGALTVALSGTNKDNFTLSTTSLTSIGSQNGTGTFTVKPNTRLTAAAYTATVTVSGGTNIAAKTFNVSFTVNPMATPLAFADSAGYDVPAGTAGMPITGINVSSGASGGTAPYAFSFEAGAPGWLSITPAGAISGTRPTTAAGATTATVKVTDSASPAATKTITIDVGAVTAAPAAVLTGGSAAYAEGSATEDAVFTIDDGIDGLGIGNYDYTKVGTDTLTAAQVTAENGSIVLTFHKAYLNTLPAGTHTAVVYLKGTGYAGLRVEIRFIVKAPDVPKTGDRATPLLWAGLLLLAGAGLAASAALSRRKRQATK